MHEHDIKRNELNSPQFTTSLLTMKCNFIVEISIFEMCGFKSYVSTHPCTQIKV